MKQSKVLIIGSGFGGLSAAIELRKIGVEDFVILERRSFMGGTWCQNTYPGAQVDVQSPLYSLSSELYDWSEIFAPQAELKAYTEHIIEKHGLRAKTILEANVTRADWDDEQKQWIVRTESKGEFRGQYLINASGPLSTPVIPAFEGRESFQGAQFHTNDWDHGYDYKGKRVAVIGSGASGAQVIPAIAEDVAELHVFQRTPHWVMPRPDYHFNKLERAVLRNKLVHRLLRIIIYWILESRVIAFKYSKALMNAFAKSRALMLLRWQVKDPALRAKLTPDYTIGCKRIILSNRLYPALCRDNVTLHADGEGIRRITPTGIETLDGTHVDLDLIVYATGFNPTEGITSCPVIGRNGAMLAKFWERYPRAYMGTMMPGFPNFFVITGPNTGIGHTSAIFIIESQMRYIMKCIRETQKRGMHAVEVLDQAEDRYTTMIHSEMERTVWKAGGCKSWYQSEDGHVIAMFPGFSFTFRRLTGRFKPDHHAFA